MFRLLFGLLLLVPYLSLAQPLGGKLVLLGGIQFNRFYTTDEITAAVILQDQTRFGTLLEANYAFWQKRNHQFFGGFRITQGILERYGPRQYYGGLGFSDDRRFSVFHTYGAQIGYRFWLPEQTKSKYGLEAGVLIIHNRLGGQVPIGLNYSYQVMPVSPAFRLGNLWSYGFVSSSFFVLWQPFPAFYRTFDANLNPSSINPPGQRDGPRVGYKSLQYGFVVGLRL